MTTIRIGKDAKNCITIDPGTQLVAIRDCSTGIGFETDQAHIGIAMRDSGIEALIDGEHAWSSTMNPFPDAMIANLRHQLIRSEEKRLIAESRLKKEEPVQEKTVQEEPVQEEPVQLELPFSKNEKEFFELLDYLKKRYAKIAAASSRFQDGPRDAVYRDELPKEDNPETTYACSDKAASLWKAAKGIEPVWMPIKDIVDMDRVMDSYVLSNGPATVREILGYVAQILNADLYCPVILTPEGRIADGYYQVVRAWREGRPEVLAVRLKELPPEYKIPYW